LLEEGVVRHFYLFPVSVISGCSEKKISIIPYSEIVFSHLVEKGDGFGSSIGNRVEERSRESCSDLKKGERLLEKLKQGIHYFVWFLREECMSTVLKVR